jgi:transcriptional regulator with XRE-family HTH domain
MQAVVGARIRNARTDLGLSQAAFARAGHSDQVPGT